MWFLVLAMVACGRTGPQRPTQRTSEPPRMDSTVTSLLELNRRMACEADKILLNMADSLQRTNGTAYAQLACGGWLNKRAAKDSEKYLYEDTPQFNEKWLIRIKTYRLNGTLVSDTEATYTVKKYDLPIAVEEAIEEMCAGETRIVLAPWYVAYGIHGKGAVAGYENVIFEVTLKNKK